RAGTGEARRRWQRPRRKIPDGPNGDGDPRHRIAACRGGGRARGLHLPPRPPPGGAAPRGGPRPMIARLTGTLAEKAADHVILDVNGVGYEVFLSATTHSALPGLGERAVLRIHTHVRDDALQLFGFATADEQ